MFLSMKPLVLGPVALFLLFSVFWSFPSSRSFATSDCAPRDMCWSTAEELKAFSQEINVVRTPFAVSCVAYVFWAFLGFGVGTAVAAARDQRLSLSSVF